MTSLQSHMKKHCQNTYFWQNPNQTAKMDRLIWVSSHICDTRETPGENHNRTAKMQRLIWVFALFIWLQAKVPFCDTRPPLILCHSVWKSGLKYNCYPCYLCYLRVTKIHCWEKSSTFWTYMAGCTTIVSFCLAVSAEAEVSNAWNKLHFWKHCVPGINSRSHQNKQITPLHCKGYNRIIMNIQLHVPKNACYRILSLCFFFSLFIVIDIFLITFRNKPVVFTVTWADAKGKYHF